MDGTSARRGEGQRQGLTQRTQRLHRVHGKRQARGRRFRSEERRNTMSEIARILDQLDRAIGGEAWHGPHLQQVLDGISAEQASMHPVRGAHSIWEIVNHLAAWNRIVHQRFAGAPVDVTPDMDWPPVWDTSEVEWRRSLENL